MIGKLLRLLGLQRTSEPEPQPRIKKKSSTLLRLQTEACRTAVFHEARIQ